MHQPPINHRARTHYPKQASNATRSSNNYNRTGRAHFSSSSTWLDLESLPLYDTTSWEGVELLDRYGHDAHASASATYPYTQPRFYLPPEAWWRTQALNILGEAFKNTIPTSRAIAWKVLSEISNQHMKKSAWAFGDIYIPISLPTSSSKLHTHIILHAAMIKELVAAGIKQSTLEISHRMLDMAHLCLNEVTGYYSNSRRLNSNTFVNVAITTAEAAISYYVNHLNQREKSEEEHRRQATFAQQQHLRKVRAKEASDELWARHHRKDRAATSINMFIRRALFLRYLRQGINHRVKIKMKQSSIARLCRGASTYAKKIKASRIPRDSTPTAPPSTAPSTNPKANPHPFRDRGLPLPKRKRRQRTRRRPSRKLRGGPISPSPTQLAPSTQQQIMMAHTLEAQQQPTTTASRYSSVPSHTDRVSTKQYHNNNNKSSLVSVVEWPLCFWAAQTVAAKMEYDLGYKKHIDDESWRRGHQKSDDDESLTPPEANTQNLGEGAEANDVYDNTSVENPHNSPSPSLQSWRSTWKELREEMEKDSAEWLSICTELKRMLSPH